MKKYNLFLFLFAVAIGFIGCSQDDSSAGPGTARVAIKLTDAPGDFAEVVVEVEDVMIKNSVEGDDEEGWTSLENVNTGPYDLLTLTGGETALLADAEIPAGYLGQIRLVLGDENYLTLEKGGQPLLLKIPSGQESGLKLQVNEDLKANTAYTFILDFDVAKSVVATSAGNYNLKPVIRVAAEATTGSIAGAVHPTAEQILVKAENGAGDASAFTDTEGNYQIHGLAPGTYKVTFTPPATSEFSVKTRTDIVVEAGEITVLEDVFFDSAEE